MRAVLGALLAGLLASCGGGDKSSGAAEAPSEYDHELQVDCLDMWLVNAGQLRGGTRMALLGELGPSENPGAGATERCSFWFLRADVSGEVAPIDLNALQGGVLFVRYAGVEYPIREGIIVEENTGTRGRGTYNTVLATDRGRVWLHGRFDFCDYVADPECPYRIEGELPHAFEIATPTMQGQGEASDCRVLIDRTTGGMQVDMQVATWYGRNVTQIYTRLCQQAPGLNDNGFQFQAGGVTGPGSYGPYRATEFPPTLPSVSLRLPVTFIPGQFANELQACALAVAQHTVTTSTVQGESTCEYSVSENPGRFTLSCKDVEDMRPTFLVPFMARGDLTLSTGCDVRYR